MSKSCLKSVAVQMSSAETGEYWWCIGKRTFKSIRELKCFVRKREISRLHVMPQLCVAVQVLCAETGDIGGSSANIIQESTRFRMLCSQT
jgi:hypothetical protein